jgi:hypothetical protein
VSFTGPVPAFAELQAASPVAARTALAAPAIMRLREDQVPPRR